MENFKNNNPNIYWKSQIGLSLIKEAILEFLEANPDGIRNSKLADLFDLHTDYDETHRDYLTYSILGILQKENKIEKIDKTYYIKK